MSNKPIKVHHVITRMIIGGAQENTLYTVEGLHADPRYDVKLITGPAVGPEGDLLARGKSKGIAVRILKHMRRSINPVRDMIIFLQLWCMFVRERPRIVHTHSSKAGILGRLAAWFAGVPVIIHTIHGLPFHPYQSRIQNRLYVFLEKLCTRISHRIIVVANAMRDKCVAQGIGTASKYLRVFSGMESSAFAAGEGARAGKRVELGLKPDDFVVAKVARLFPLKGHRDLIDAAPDLCDRFPHMRFLFIGDGVLQDSLKARIDELGLTDRFVFAGLVPPSTVPAYLAAADMVVHTSYREGLARVLPQGLLSCRPVVSYNVDGAPEVIEDGVNGHLVAPGDLPGLGAAMADVAGNYDRFRASVAQQVPELERTFSIEKMVEDIIFCYLTFTSK
jgi:glycosyltransferase involved in cell wall biosynthesis